MGCLTFPLQIHTDSWRNRLCPQQCLCALSLVEMLYPSPDQFNILFFLQTSCSSKLSGFNQKFCSKKGASSEILQEQVLSICLSSFVCPVDASLVSPWSISSQRWVIPNMSISFQWRFLLILGYLIFSCSVTSFLMAKHRFLCLSFPKTPGLRLSCCLALGLSSSGTCKIRGVGSGRAPMHLQNGRHFWPLSLGHCLFLPLCLPRRENCSSSS